MVCSTLLLVGTHGSNINILYRSVEKSVSESIVLMASTSGAAVIAVGISASDSVLRKAKNIGVNIVFYTMDSTIPYFAYGSKGSYIISNMLDSAIRRRGFRDGSILRDWRIIVGEGLWTSCLPVKIATHQGFGKTLYLKAVNLQFLAEFKYKKSLIISRVNAYSGDSFISDVKLV